MKAILRRIRISSKKANLVAALVRNKDVTDAIDLLKYTPKKAAGILKKVIESAVANAESNFKQQKENLYIKEIVVTEGPTFKRSIPISKGRMHPLLKRTAHITVKVEAKKEEPKKVATKKAAPKTEKAEVKKEKVKKEPAKEATDNKSPKN
ncbi:50S ribosomal protein L22 [Candidatus Peregrinibacteria bacterium]|jgi:large subunit ribosomal protein L22|nr:50S ribosomal protein L22 [Candidatus Peregrinibacteria bacterium]MBT6401817.1 50S ribosomal protein L22 [candidate division WWE3 bacterium]MBT7736188.1 50S ribosomal protein L22 [Candidatus Peregrinibacteria bacterium]